MLSNPEIQKEISELPVPWDMSFSSFSEKYNRVMNEVSKKEKKGRLDPASKPYEQITEEENILLKSDWKQFSRNRGFSEEDIAEYEVWLVLSGQKDDLPGAINDPWRRNRPNWDKNIWLKQIEFGLKNNFRISEQIQNEYFQLKGQTEQKLSSKEISSDAIIPSISNQISKKIDDLEVW